MKIYYKWLGKLHWHLRITLPRKYVAAIYDSNYLPLYRNETNVIWSHNDLHRPDKFTNVATWNWHALQWYFSGINRSEEKYFRFCCVHGKVKVVRNQVYRRSKVVLGVLRVLSTLVVGFSVKKGPILLLKLRKVIVFFCELRKTLFSVLTRKKRTFLLHQEMGPFLLNTQQHRWTTLAHQELPCSCDKLDFWQPLLLHGRSNSGNIFSLDL